MRKDVGMQEDRSTDKRKEMNEFKINNNDNFFYAKETGISEDEMLDTVVIKDEYEAEEELSDSLKQQVTEELEIQQLLQNEQKNESKYESKYESKKPGTKNIKKKILLAIGITLTVLLIFTIFLVGTRSGRRMVYQFAGNMIYNQVEKEDEIVVTAVTLPENNTTENHTQTEVAIATIVPDIVIEPRQEEYVKNFLIFGIEEIENASNTDSMMIASINSRDNTIKLTSLLRDTYVDIPGAKPNKLNSVYALGGSDKLISTIEQNYRIKIDGYAHINFNSFEKIVNRLGGISIELGEEEAHYLNTTNYISERANRTVTAGMNDLNGNQALGYCRVRNCETLGGANNDYGRTLRQRRVLSAIFQKYKSQSFLNLLPIMTECLGYVYTNMTASQIEDSLEAIVENKIATMDTCRIPANGMFEDPDEYNGVDDPLVLNWDENVKELYKFIFLDTDAEATEAVAAQSR